MVDVSYLIDQEKKRVSDNKLIFAVVVVVLIATAVVSVYALIPQPVSGTLSSLGTNSLGQPTYVYIYNQNHTQISRFCTITRTDTWTSQEITNAVVATQVRNGSAPFQNTTTTMSTTQTATWRAIFSSCHEK